MRRLFFDIETIPADSDDSTLVSEYERLSAKKKDDPTFPSFETFVDQSALKGEFGKIICLGAAVDDGEVKSITGDEEHILRLFWGAAEKSITQFVGHNILNFDFPFIMKRSRIHGIQPTRVINFARYRNTPVYDTMQEWELYGWKGPTLDLLTKVLGIESPKGSMDGSKVAKAYSDGKIDEIAKYCERDVEAVRQVFKRMEFEQ